MHKLKKKSNFTKDNDKIACTFYITISNTFLFISFKFTKAPLDQIKTISWSPTTAPSFKPGPNKSGKPNSFEDNYGLKISFTSTYVRFPHPNHQFQLYFTGGRSMKVRDAFVQFLQVMILKLMGCCSHFCTSPHSVYSTPTPLQIQMFYGS